ncbi:MAG: hypothetical protein Q9161_007424 [Pseudevernia consocians]
MNGSSEITGGLPAPPGVKPNFVDPESLHVYNVICQAVCLPASTLFVLARLFTKLRVKPPMGPEDCKSSHFLFEVFDSIGKTDPHQTPASLHGEAEITTGIICSCVPTLPAFYRHYIPRFTSLFSLVNPRCNTKSTGVSSAFSFRDKIPGSRHQELGVNGLTRADYLELGTLPGGSSSEIRNGPVTTIEGGVDVRSVDAGGALKRDGVGENGIKKTVRLELYPQHTEDTRTG